MVVVAFDLQTEEGGIVSADRSGEDLAMGECNCPYPNPAMEDVHRGCPVHGELAIAFAPESVAMFSALLSRNGFPVHDMSRSDVVYSMVGVAETFLRRRQRKPIPYPPRSSQ